MNIVYNHMYFPCSIHIWACCEFATREKKKNYYMVDPHLFAFITSTAAANKTQVVESGHLVLDGSRGITEFS